MKLALLALVTTLSLGGAAIAQPAAPYAAPPPPPPGAPHAAPHLAPPPGAPHAAPHGDAARPRGELRRFLLEHFDEDRSGRLESEERRRAIRLLRKAARKLERAERGARGHDGRTRGLIRRFDHNRDGVVGPGEIPPDAARRLRRLDRNRDGWLDDSDRR